MYTTKVKQRSFFQLLWLTTLLKFSQTTPIPCEGVAGNLNSQLSHYSKRFEYILKTAFEPTFETDMHELIDVFNLAMKSTNIKGKEALLQNYMEHLNATFREYLERNLDGQYLNEEIRMEEWYFCQMLPQLEPRLAIEVAEFLPLYQRALLAPQFDEKYELFANIEENFSEELLSLLDAQPENVAILNAQLTLFKEFLLYILQMENLIVKYEQELHTLLTTVESALNDSQFIEKLETAYLFDDIKTPFGRFLNCMIDDFELFKFTL